MDLAQYRVNAVLVEGRSVRFTGPPQCGGLHEGSLGSGQVVLLSSRLTEPRRALSRKNGTIKCFADPCLT